MGIEVFVFIAATMLLKAEVIDQKVDLQNQVAQLQQQVETTE